MKDVHPCSPTASAGASNIPYNIPARKPTPAPKLTTTHPAPRCASILEAEAVMLTPPTALPVAIAATPLRLMPVFIVIEGSIDMSMPMLMLISISSMDLAPLCAAEVGVLSHIIVTTFSPDAVAVAVADAEDFMPDCARASGAKARRVRVLRAARALGCMVAVVVVVFGRNRIKSCLS